jgi:D-glycerate 3-kinase
MTEKAVRTIIERALAREGLDGSPAAPLGPAYAAVAQCIAGRAHSPNPLIVGICGPQGSGKSTLASVLQQLLDHVGLPTARFSLDDIYLPLAERKRLAETVHPLLRTRGVPGTHDVALGLSTLQALAAAEVDSVTPIPSFDKAADDCRPVDQWSRFSGRPHVILFEGWCVGARPQDDEALVQPINALERDDDPDGAWRRAVNERLRTEYQSLFCQLDMLVLLRPPRFETVFAWRKQQEDRLRENLRSAAHDARRGGVMDDVQLDRFIRHYERITRHILAEMPSRADICVSFRHDRSIANVVLPKTDGD